MTKKEVTLVMISADELEGMKMTLEKILIHVTSLQQGAKNSSTEEYISALNFMNAVGIKRTKFDELVHKGLLRIIRKKRRIYLPSSEITRYFSDTTIK